MENKQKQLIISVSDKRVGLKNEDMDKLFRIEHSHSTLGTSKEKGTGFG
ncbi:hypothetical protein [Labilibaculum euxinus]|uniref:Uncharacterized protein n=1 Tax=Labilibaculum euxinus TaxID=2686357 RepID=A0A7M4D8P6_9BACT|nr:hypothetical protein [Labilibaculum euxinus]MUP39025.1 hypothetical protein [Labilibaculum euxinus]MVB08230.1 hypothetical protein [Labilibaculum euxinus]